jgi:A/G-specific adenine glycosylase
VGAESNDAVVEFPDARWRRRLRQALLDWFAESARDLPWRRTRDPYAIWISETMLQQTQVETVRGYYERFLQRFPTVVDLAEADEQEVLRVWEGLGYYRRARQLHQAARQIVDRHGGRFPHDLESVRQLPGVGRYTAGAVLSIALDQPLPILEANTIRLYCRLLAFSGDPYRAAGQKLLWDFAEFLVPESGAGTFNQALMELGSGVCRPAAPACLFCPVTQICPTRAQGLQEQIPQGKTPKQYEAVHEAAVLVRRQEKLLVRRCAANERWAGLWDFPRFTIDALPAPQSHVVQRVEEMTGLKISLGEQLTQIKYGVTRFRITLAAYEAKYRSGKLNGQHECRWIPVNELSELPLSVTGRKLTRFA